MELLRMELLRMELEDEINLRMKPQNDAMLLSDSLDLSHLT